MDDYGSSFSSMTNLRCYPFDKLKIDRAMSRLSITTRSLASSFIAHWHLAGALD